MKKCFLDSNILVYFKDSLSLHHAAATEKIKRLVAGNIQLYISPLILDEFLYIFRLNLIKRKIPQPYNELRRAIKEILQIPLILLISPPLTSDKQLQVIDYMERFDLKPRDAYHLLSILSSAIDSFATFDTDFRKVFATKILQKI